MNKKELFYTKVPVTVPVICYKKMFSEPKIYIPYKISSTGKKVACISAGCSWYVYFYFRNPTNDKMEKHIYKKGINRLSTVTERREASENLKKGLQKMLYDGFSPFADYVPKDLITPEISEYTVLTAFNAAFESRKNEWKQSTRNTNFSIFQIFKDWLHKTALEHLPIENFKRKQVVQFLDHMLKVRKANSTTRNNYKRAVSSLLSKMVEIEIIEHNPADKVLMLKETPTKNKSFSNNQLIEIRNWLQINDPYLHQYLKFITYAFMRPVEVNRIKVKHIDLDRKQINVDTKTNANFVQIIDVLADVINELNIKNCNKDFYIFSKFEKPALWDAENDKSRSDFFSRRFKKLKKHFNYGNEFGIYSFRHNASLNLFFSFMKSGLSENEAVEKLQRIMRHNNAKTTRIYLRDIGAFSVKDYSKDYTFEF